MARIVALLFLPVFLPGFVNAAWVPDGVGCAVAPELQQSPLVVADDAGGVFVAWRDARSDGACSEEPHVFCSYDVYLQHLTRSGDVAAGWPANGLPICTTGDDQQQVRLVADGVGGCIVAWLDWRSGSLDVYATRIEADGSRAGGWLTDANVVCAAPSTQIALVALADGSGGAYFAWLDDRVAGNNNQIYLQHISGSGTIALGWPEDGFAVSPGGISSGVGLAPDGAGGVFVTWQDERDEPSSRSMYAQRVTASAELAPGWQIDGNLVATGYAALSGKVISDGSDGCLVAWVDWDVSSSSHFVAAQRLTGAGQRAPGWPEAGVRIVSGEVTNSIAPALVFDADEGLIAIWPHRVLVGSQWEGDLLAVHLRGDASLDPGWPVDGVVICAASGSQVLARAVTDGHGGALVTWADPRAGLGAQDIYALRVAAKGAPAVGWPIDGLAICSASGMQRTPAICLADAGAAIVAWTDERNDTEEDVYVQRVTLLGALPTEINPPTPGLRLMTAHPSPFTREVRVVLRGSAVENTVADVYDVAGRVVRRLGFRGSGANECTAVWDGMDASMRALPAGLYVVHLRGADSRLDCKVVKAP